MIHSRYLHTKRYLCRHGNRSFERGGFHKRGSFFFMNAVAFLFAYTFLKAHQLK